MSYNNSDNAYRDYTMNYLQRNSSNRGRSRYASYDNTEYNANSGRTRSLSPRNRRNASTSSYNGDNVNSYNGSYSRSRSPDNSRSYQNRYVGKGKYNGVVSNADNSGNGYSKRIGSVQYPPHPISYAMLPYLTKGDLKYVADQLGIKHNIFTPREELVNDISFVMKQRGSYARPIYLKASSYDHYRGKLQTTPYEW